MATILIVDDASPSRKKLKKILQEGQHTIIEAVDGEEGIQLAHDNPDIDLILSDYNMPLVNGVEMLREIRKIKGHENILAGMVTSECTTEVKNEGREVGVLAWIVKPINPQVLNSVIENMLKKVEEMRT